METTPPGHCSELIANMYNVQCIYTFTCAVLYIYTIFLFQFTVLNIVLYLSITICFIVHCVVVLCCFCMYIDFLFAVAIIAIA